jgi:hypothetical protein
MGVKLGNTDFTGGYMGSSPVNALYFGGDKVWPLINGSLLFIEGLEITPALESTYFSGPYTITANNSAGGNTFITGSGDVALIQGSTTATEIIDTGFIKEIDGTNLFRNNNVLTNIKMDGLTIIKGGSFNFYNCSNLSSVDFPNLTTLENFSAFQLCTNLSNINMPSCTKLGFSVGPNSIFGGVPNNGTATFNSFLQTNNGGSVDGDIEDLINKGWTITWV